MSKNYKSNPYATQLDPTTELKNTFRKTIHTAMRAGFQYDAVEAMRQELAKMEEADRLREKPLFSNSKRIAIIDTIRALEDLKKHV